MAVLRFLIIQLHQYKIIVLNEKTRCGWIEDSHIVNSNSKFSENMTQVSQNNAFESSNFLYDINVDYLTGCHSRLHIQVLAKKLEYFGKLL